MCLFKCMSTTEIYTYSHTLSRHDALPISAPTLWGEQGGGAGTPAMVADRRSSFAPPPQARAEPAYAPPPESTSFPLGVSRGQVAKTYIVAEAEDGLVIVDQHAAHERSVLERMRSGMAGPGDRKSTRLNSSH